MFKTHRTFDLETGVKNNTIAVVVNSNALNVVYHKTIVVKAVRVTRGKCKGAWRVTLSNGGWDTISTKIVINNALSQLGGCGGVFLEKIKGTMFLNVRGERKPFYGKIEFLSL